MAGKAIYVTS